MQLQGWTLYLFHERASCVVRLCEARIASKKRRKNGIDFWHVRRHRGRFRSRARRARGCMYIHICNTSYVQNITVGKYHKQIKTSRLMRKGCSQARAWCWEIREDGDPGFGKIFPCDDPFLRWQDDCLWKGKSYNFRNIREIYTLRWAWWLRWSLNQTFSL